MENLQLQNLEQIETLLKSKKFDALDASERDFVLSSMTENEYNEMHFLFQNIAEVSDKIEPNENTKSKLDQAFQSTEVRRTVPFLSRKLPVFKVAAVAAICFMLGFGIKSIDTNNQKSDSIADSIIYDTVQVIRYIQMPLNKTFAMNSLKIGCDDLKLKLPSLEKNYYHSKDAMLLASRDIVQNRNQHYKISFSRSRK